MGQHHCNHGKLSHFVIRITGTQQLYLALFSQPQKSKHLTKAPTRVLLPDLSQMSVFEINTSQIPEVANLRRPLPFRGHEYGFPCHSGSQGRAEKKTTVWGSLVISLAEDSFEGPLPSFCSKKFLIMSEHRKRMMRITGDRNSMRISGVSWILSCSVCLSHDP